MAHRLTLERLLFHAGKTEQAAARLTRPGWLLRIGRESRFTQQIDRFLSLLHYLPQPEAERATVEQEAELRRRIDAIIDSVELFLAEHRSSSRSGLERNQRLASRIYDLRQAFEALARGATSNPHIMDVRREEKLSHAHG
jgi:hypothetical protein